MEEPLESRSRLVSAPPVAPESVDAMEPPGAMEPLDLGNEPTPLAPSDPTIEVAAAEVSRAELDALVEEEEPPSSSRRMITIEEKMQELDDDVAPLHPPPPESGRLPTALPTFELAFEPEANSIRLEEVHEPSDLGPIRVEASAVRVEASPDRERTEVSVTRAEPPEDAEVAVFVAPTRSGVSAKTFGDVLDDALSL